MEESRELTMEELELVVGGQSSETFLKWKYEVINIMNLNNRWNPRKGDLVLYRGNNEIYQVLEVSTRNNGWSEFLVHGSNMGLQTLSTLNCDPVEHSSETEYDINTTSKGDL